ncbi:hypothetical protein DEU56DRAFT_181933 [Suillus clintonianus]|uniref:uncharacterized protein n=1 Tax=Suillus clintonianus TaxID=1904413 RepID=UPI001B85E2CA|nr:uncharacterized protein DEU56DRAFT_181933 [Suillus clintonianus]KAG2145791.1 hypothetical protein DEU56DRAFT_181933 [Suillus clintonianus]
MPTITDLPDELLDEIACLLPKGTLFSLCTVSNRFRPRAARWLYRCLALAGNGETIKICKVLISNKLAAISVRKVLLWPGIAFSRPSLTGGPFYLYLSAFYNLLSRALSRATNVESIRLMFPYCGASLSLDACTFPNLRSFATTMEPRTLASFVKRHPQLQELHISPSDLRSIPLSEFSGICLSSLNSVCLPEPLLFIISPEAPIQSVLSPEIEDDNEEIPNYIRHLSRYRTTLSDLHLCRPHWNGEILMRVATSLPKIRAFTFTRMIPGLRHHSNAAFLEACEAALPFFSSLSHLRIEVARHQELPGFASLSDYRCDFKMVQIWGNKCPTLDVCLFPSGTAWHRIEDNAWMPDLHHKVAIQWFFDAASTNQFPIDVMGSIQQFCDSTGRIDTLGLLKFRSPSAMESIDLYPRTEEDEFYSSDSDWGDLEIEE